MRGVGKLFGELEVSEEGHQEEPEPAIYSQGDVVAMGE